MRQCTTLSITTERNPRLSHPTSVYWLEIRALRYSGCSSQRTWEEDEDDVVLFAVFLRALFHADDLALLSYSEQGLQRKIDRVIEWCTQNGLTVSPSKSEGMTFSSSSVPKPNVWVGDASLTFVRKACYVGVWFCSNPKHLSCQHLKEKANAAQRMSYGVFHPNSFLGVSPIETSIKLYFARVDPHLTHGADVFLGDSIPQEREEISRAQISFLRRLLYCGYRSYIQMLYAETGILPIQYRRLILAITAHHYYITAPRTSLLHSAMQVANSLQYQGHRSWSADLLRALQDLHLVPRHADFMWLMNPDFLLKLGKRILDHAFNSIFTQVATSGAAPLLHQYAFSQLARRNMPQSRARFARLHPYLLHIRNPDLRRVMTKFLLRQLHVQYTYRFPPRTPPPCRFCADGNEGEAHILCQCKGIPELVNARRNFHLAVSQVCPHLPSLPEVTAPSVQDAIGFIDSWSNLENKDLQFVQLFAVLIRDTVVMFGN